jgi:Tfp pilus assembly protein PilO
MRARLLEKLQDLDSRIVALAMLLLIGLLVAEVWLLLLRVPYRELRKIQATHVALAASVDQSLMQSDELGKVAGELQLLTAKLRGQLRVPASDDELVASLMAALDQSAARYGIVLAGMKPGSRRQVSVFEEISFEIAGNGNYLQLCQWMLDFEQTLGGSATVTEFDMKTAGDGGRVAVTFNIALYRPLKLQEAAHDS